MHDAGHFSFTYSRTQPYTYGNVFMQPLDWLEVGFRYIDISNRLYGPAELSGTQSYKDKSVDAKIRLWSESAYLPQIAVGVRDVAGTGLFSSEYLVAGKRTGPLDWSLGLGWGYMAGQPHQAATVGTGGNFSFGSYFGGQGKLFGGVQYQTPWAPLLLKLEYDANDYQHEPQGNIQWRNSPWNFGLVYRAARPLDISLGIERGNALNLGVTLHTQLDGMMTPKVSDPPRLAVAATRPQQSPDWSLTVHEIERQTDWHVRSIEQRSGELRVTIDDAGAGYWRERVERAAEVLHRDAPAAVDRFALTYRERGIAVAEHVVDRDAWVKPQIEALPPSEQREPIIARAPEKMSPGTTLYGNSPQSFEADMSVGWQQTLGGPDGFVLYQIYALEQAKLKLFRDDTWLQGSLKVGLIDNYNKFTYAGFSNLPRVRTYLREYLTTSRVMIPNLQLTHVGKLSENQYYSVYGGYLEEMFGGVGAEWMYRPFASRIALGVDVNAVQQRNFEQNLNFDNAGNQTGYRTATGHATLYWDTGWNDVQAALSVGRYLAKDFGATIGLARSFENGVAVGAFMTKTNVSAAQFGEGSFDKGIFVSIPFDTMLTRSTRNVGNFVWKPLTRDGGAKLGRGVSLYDITSPRSDRTLEFKPAPQPNENTIAPDRRETWNPKPAGPEPYTRVTPRPITAQLTADTTDHSQSRSTSTLYDRLTEALYGQQFRNIRVGYDDSHRLTIALTNNQLQPISRAVGRAARTALRLAPLDAREMRVTFADRIDPVVTYNFIDLQRLERYFSGTLKASELANYVTIDYLNPAVRENDPLAQLNDTEPGSGPSILATLKPLQPETFSLRRVGNNLVDAAHGAKDTDWLRAGVIGTGLILASSMLDRRASKFAEDHATNRLLKGETTFGNVLPWVGLAGAALAAFDGSDPARSRTGYAAGEAGGAAIIAATGLKYLAGRARPVVNEGSHSFKPFSSASNYDSFPSIHTIVSWAVATPFAQEYDAPWLYGLAGLTNLSRVMGRDHWVSDTVAGSLLGYGIGRIFWESSRSPNNGAPRVFLERTGVKLSWDY